MSQSLTTVGAVLKGIVSGKSIQTLERPVQGDEFGILKVSAVTWGTFRPAENKALPADYDPKDCPRPMNGDILISRANTRELVGAPVMVKGDHPQLLLSDKLLKLIPDETAVDAGYLVRALRAPSATMHFYKRAGGSSGSMTNITQSDIRTAPIYLPPLPEQRRIAAILDQAETLRTPRRTALALLDSLTQSLFLDMFGDPVANPKGWQALELQDVVKQDTIVTYGIVQAGEEFPGGIPYIRTGDIVDGSIRLSGLRHTDPEIAAKFARSRVEENEIVMSIRATVGTTALVPVELSGANLTQGTARIAPGADVHFQYLLYFLRSDATQQWIERQVKGATFREITLGRLRELPVLVPPLPLQQTFATRIAAIEVLNATHRRALATLDALFASLQQRAFSGELTLAAPRASAQSLEQLQQLKVSIGQEALIFIAKRMPDGDLYNSLKAIYFADRHHLEHHGRQIYNETYSALTHGPVPQAAYDATNVLCGKLLLSSFDDDAVRAALRRKGDTLTALRDADFSKLSRAVIESLEWGIRYCRDMKFGQTKTASHDSAYERTPKNEAIPLQYIIDTLPPEARQRHWNL